MTKKKNNTEILVDDDFDSIEIEDSYVDQLESELVTHFDDSIVFQDEIDEIIQIQIQDEDVGIEEYRKTFQQIENRFIDLSISQKIYLVVGAIAIISIGVCSQIFTYVISDLPNASSVLAEYNRYLSIGIVLVITVGFLLGFFLSSTITRPLKKLREGVDRMMEGNYSSPVHQYATDEVGKVIEFFNYMMIEVSQRRLEKERTLLEQAIENKKKEKKNIELRRLIDLKIHETESTYEFLFAAINSIEQGLFIFDQDGKCADLYTASCEEIFGVSPQGNSLFEVLKIHDQNDRDTYKTWLNTLFSDKFDLEMIIPLGPVHYVKAEAGDEDFQFVDIQYFPMRDDDTDEIINVVAIATDRTNEKINEKELKEQKNRAQMILSVLKNRSLFHHFAAESKKLLDEITTLAMAKELNLEQIKIAIHSIKGMASSFYSSEVHSVCHQVESHIQAFEKDMAYEKLKRLIVEGAEKIRSSVFLFISSISQLTGHNFLEANLYREVRVDHLEDFGLKLKNLDRSLYSNFVEEFIKVPAASFVSNFDLMIEKLSRKLNKKIAPIQIINGDIKLDPNMYVNFFQNLNHLINNIVDHAIEESEYRFSVGKCEHGNIKLEFFQDSTYWGLKVSDDGRGIDPKVLKQKLKELNIYAGYEDMPDEELLYVIFNPEFSTKNSVSGVSGRGVGMSALKQAVEELHGNVELESSIGTGSVFVFTFPIESANSKNHLKSAA